METFTNILAAVQITLFAAFLYFVVRLIISLIKDNKSK